MTPRSRLFCIFLVLFSLLFCGCTAKQEPEHSGQPRDNTPHVLIPSADGITVFQNDYAVIDASHTSQGYVIVCYRGTCNKAKVRITGPNENTYTYLLSAPDVNTVFPLPAGDGIYDIQVLEHMQDDAYAVALTEDVEVQLENEFLPFLYPNQYVDFQTDSAAVVKGQELAADAWTDLEVVQNIYEYVITHISYDTEKAASVSYGYVPDVDAALESGTGICFDYAALMAAMLRSQNIPTKLEIGYSDEIYHSWISCYIDDQGWVDNMIEFNGHEWQLLNPTLAAGNDPASVKEYVSDQSHHIVKYSY